MKAVWGWSVILGIVCAGCATSQYTTLIGPMTGTRYELEWSYVTFTPQAPQAYQREVWLANYVKRYPETGEDLRQHMLRGFVRKGMTREQAAVTWGQPTDIKRDIDLWGVREEWVYGQTAYRRRHLYFKDDRLTKWQE